MTKLIELLKALSDETRFKLVKILINYDLCVGALASRLNISQSAVSQHLKILRSTGIIKGDKRGYYTHYYVDRRILEEAAEQIAGLSSVVSSDDECHKYFSKNHICSRKEVKKDEQKKL